MREPQLPVNYFPNPNESDLIHILLPLDKASGIPDLKLTTELNLADRLSLSWAQTFLFDTYLNAQIGIRRVGKTDMGFDFTLDQLKSAEIDYKPSSFHDMILQGSALRYRRFQRILFNAAEQEEVMSKDPNMNHMRYFMALGGDLHRDIIMAKWEDNSGRITDHGVKLLSSTVGSPAGIKDMAHMISSVICAENSRGNDLEATIRRFAEQRNQ